MQQAGDDLELALLVACAAWPPSDQRVAAVHKQAAEAIDWTRFESIVLRHRMAGMVANGLSAAGVAVPAGIREPARIDLVQALATGCEALRLVAALANEDIGATVLKGPPLAMLAYGTLAVRQIRDLDLLVAPADLPRAMAVLEEQGLRTRYEDSAAGLRPDRSIVLKDVEFHDPATGILVELHARLSENADLLPATSLSATSPVAIAPGLSLPAPTGDAMLLYLMVHGFRHGWHRLKWLADVAALAAAMPERDLRAFAAGAHRQGFGVIVSSTWLVLDRVMATPVPSDLLTTAQANRRARWCAAVAIRHLSDERDVDAQVVTGLLATATKLLASSSPRYLVREVARMLVDNGIAIRLGGGRSALALSVVLRPLWLPVRHARRAWCMRRGR